MSVAMRHGIVSAAGARTRHFRALRPARGTAGRRQAQVLGEPWPGHAVRVAGDAGRCTRIRALVSAEDGVADEDPDLLRMIKAAPGPVSLASMLTEIDKLTAIGSFGLPEGGSAFMSSLCWRRSVLAWVGRGLVPARELDPHGRGLSAAGVRRERAGTFEYFFRLAQRVFRRAEQSAGDGGVGAGGRDHGVVEDQEHH